MYAMGALSVPAIIATGSRGGMLALVGGVVLTTWRKTNWWKAAVVLAVLAPIVFAIVPAYQRQRYETLQEWRQDQAAMGRIRGWETSLRMAGENPITGIGLGMETFLAEYPKYRDVTDPLDTPHVAHSVWFSTLAGAGYPGLLLLIGLIAATFYTTARTRRLAERQLGGKRSWAYNYAAMIEIAVVTFMIAASFLSQVGFEYVYVVMLLSVPLYALARQEVSEAREAGAAATTQAPPDALPVTA
jgi:O-antigen ligase